MPANNFSFSVNCIDGVLEVKSTELEPMDLMTILVKTLTLVPDELQEQVISVALEASKLDKERIQQQVH